MLHARRAAFAAPALLAVLCLGTLLRAQVPSVTPPAPPETPPQEQPKPEDEGWQALHSWEAEPVVVSGEALPELREEELIGPYNQPRWTATRRFTNTRIYVIPEGEIDVEYWMRTDVPQHGDKTYKHMYEVEIGLPNRFQFDFYAVADHEGANVPLDINEQMYELRWALADWGKLWGNPTLYFELVNRTNEPDKVEAKLLLGDEAAPGWHWGTNLVVEQETGGEREREVELTAGLSKTIIDEKFSAGGEIKMSRINTDENRDDFTDEFFVGPSFQWRPHPRCHVDFAPLVGVGGESGKAQIFFIVGWEF